MISDPKISTGFITVLQDILDRPIAFHRVFVKVTGSVAAALMLSQAMYWSQRTRSNGEGWFYKTRDQWEEETGLSRYEQENARKTLRRFSFWKEELRGVPAQMHYRIDMTALSEELMLISGPRLHSKKPFKNTRLLKTSQLDGGKPTNKKAANHPTCLLETSQHYKGISETTTETIKTTTPFTPLESFSVSSVYSSGGRVFVEKLLVGTMLHAADPGRIAKIARKYERTSIDIEKAIDVLDQQYRQSAGKINDPTALVVCALKNGIDPSKGFVPKVQREAEVEQRRKAAKQKADEERRRTEGEVKAHREAEEQLLVLSKERREELFKEAKTRLPAVLRSSQMAAKVEAIKLLIARAKKPD